VCFFDSGQPETTFTVQIHLHVGLDKAGSSAIQAHVNLNRNWFHAHGIVIPHSGFTGSLGHHDLFRDSKGVFFEPLRSELDDFSRQGFEKAFLSWEGLHSFSLQQLDFIRRQLDGHEILPLIYLREQSEIIQSGYFQSVKHGRQLLTIEQILCNEHYLFNDSRDYFALLSKLEAVFGHRTVQTRLYDSDTLCQGNVVLDCLEAIGLARDANFILAPNRQNSSLNLVSTRLLNLLDGYFDDPAGREIVVDSLLDNINNNEASGKYFLEQKDQKLIREYFRTSNEKVVTHFLNSDHPYPELFPYQRKTYCEPQTSTDEIAFHAIITLLENLTQIPVWNGAATHGHLLTQWAKPKSGWWPAAPEGVWSTGSESILRFRVLRKHLSPFSKTLTLTIKGEYAQNESETWISACGLELGKYDLRNTELEIPIARVRESRIVELRLGHKHRISADDTMPPEKVVTQRQELTTTDQSRTYRLQWLEYAIT